jgi:hypothetical protein
VKTIDFRRWPWLYELHTDHAWVIRTATILIAGRRAGDAVA